MTYLQHYDETIRPQLEDIDIFIRSKVPFTTSHIADLLQLNEGEIHSIVKNEAIHQLNAVTFFSIMRAGSSPICSLFRRELERGYHDVYTLDDISYIYNIPMEDLKDASKNFNQNFYNRGTLNQLFSNIPYNN